MPLLFTYVTMKVSMMNKLFKKYLYYIPIVLLLFSGCNPLGVESGMGGNPVNNNNNNGGVNSPVISRVIPDVGDIVGGTSLSIRGAYFENGSKVYIGDTECLNAQFVAASEIRCTSPSGSTGNVDVKIENPNGDEYTLSDGYEYVVTNITITGPNSGVDFTTSEQGQMVHGTCTRNITSLSSSIGVFIDEDCSDGTWSLDTYSLNTGINSFVISGTTTDGEASSSDTINITYTPSVTSFLIIGSPNSGTNFSTNVQTQTLSGTCSTDIVNLSSTLGTFSDNDCSDGTWVLDPFMMSAGVNNFVISGEDGGGTSISDSLSITYDNVAPAVAITSPNAGADFVTSSMSQTVSGTCGTDVVNMTTSLGGFSDDDCANGTWSLAPFALSVGLNTFTITAYDVAGNSSTATINITYDSASYSINISSPNNGISFSTNIASQTISGSCTTGLTGLSSTLGTFSDSNCSDGTWSLNAYTLSSGANSFTISGLTPAGNTVSDTFTITYDTGAPSVAITAPNSGTNFITAQQVQTISGTCSTDVVSMTTSSGYFADSDCSDATWSLTPSVLAAGSNTFTINAYDSAGNNANAAMVIVYDSTPAALAITSPNNGSNFSTSIQSQTISGTCTTDVTNLATNVGSFADNSCADGTWALNAISLNSGNNTITISGEDNFGSTLTASIVINYDTVSPTLSITSPNAGADFTTSTLVQTVSGLCGSDVVSLTTSLGNFADSDCADGTWSLNPYVLDTGVNTFTITATDAAGNQSVESINIDYDTTPASLLITAPNSGMSFTTNVQSQTISGTCTTNITNLATTTGTFADSDCSNGTWALNAISLSAGVNTVQISGEDGGGSPVSDSITITYDTMAPTVSITSPNAGADFTTSTLVQTVSGICGSDVTSMTTSLGSFADDDCSDGTWSLNAAVLSSGANLFTITAYDAAGNYASAAITITYDDTAPTAPSVSATTPTTNTTPTWSWTAGTGGNGTFRYKLDDPDLTSGATTTTSLSYTPGSPLSVAAHTLYVQERDDAGNWSASGSSAITIETCRSVVTWGRNLYGQLGLNINSPYITTPTDLPSFTNVTKVSGGYSAAGSFSAALKNDGTVWTWGNNDYGQLGDGTFGTRTLPQQVPSLSGIMDVTASAYNVIALKNDGTVWVWGGNAGNQLGDGSAVTRTSPIMNVGIPSGITKISNNGPRASHTLAIASDTTVWAWGTNGAGQLGTNNITASTIPIHVVDTGGTGNISNVIEVATSQYNSLALKGDNTVWAWGTGTSGQLGNNASANSYNPVQVQVSGGAALSGIIAIASGTNFNIALKNDGTVWAWGLGTSGQLGDNTLVSKNYAIQVTSTEAGGFLTDVAKISAGDAYVAAIKNDGTIWIWGGNAGYQLGDGTTTTRKQPVQLAGITDALQVAAEYDHTLLTTTSNTVRAWGSTIYGQLGIEEINKNLPAAVYGFETTDVLDVSAGTSHTLLVRASDNTVWSAGLNTTNQLGDNTAIQRNTFVQVHGYNDVGYLTDVTNVSASSAHSLALKNDGTVWAWGSGANGRLGDNTIITKDTPVQVVGTGGTGTLQNIIAITTGQDSSYALKNDGTVWAWGLGGNGQLGNNGTGNLASPVQVKALAGTQDLTDVKAISSANGASHALALKNDGTVWAWGLNTYGQLGDGTITQRNSAVQVLNLTNVIAISAGGYHSLALKNDGTVWAWGANGSYQLGDGMTTPRYQPYQVFGLTGITGVEGGYNYSIAVKNDGTAWAWGALNNNYGQIGDNTVGLMKPYPVQVSGITHVTKVNAGYNHNIVEINCSY